MREECAKNEPENIKTRTSEIKTYVYETKLISSKAKIAVVTSSNGNYAANVSKDITSQKEILSLRRKRNRRTLKRGSDFA